MLLVTKKYNLERHYRQTMLVIGSIRGDYLLKKRRELFNRQNIFVKRHNELESMVIVSYEISLLLAKQKKPFSDGEIVKEALTIFALNCEDKNVKAQADSVSLSRHTFTRRKRWPLISAGRSKKS
ncbi:unnamed protein product [Diatraea saccharalis]|uniref:Uncharacterized protein n=1 Tax=Diatraea saccharalis TaxID=40085 RepID=A0A9N9WHC6_9NEOP|nr:unnamed protein product [Diatraea saccharalis]